MNHSFNPIQFPDDSISFIAPSWSQLELLTFEVAKQILADGEKIDRIVTLAKGGWPQTCSLVDFLNVEYVASMGVKFYKGIGQRMEKPIIYQDIPEVIYGEDLLLFDDVTDSGESFIFTKEYLLTKGAKSVRTASLFHKPHSKFVPNYFGAKTSAWIVFPFELRETIEQLNLKWTEAGVPHQDQENRFIQLGFPDSLVSYFIK